MDPGAQGALGDEQGAMRGTEGSLRGHVVSGGMWIALTRALSLALQATGTVILGRLLTPDDFGLFALAMLFVRFAFLLVSAGLGHAIIQRPRLTQTHLSTAFWMNWAGGVLTFVAVVVAAPLIAGFFGQADLTWLVSLVGLTFVFQVGTVPVALLQRAFRFRAIAVVESGSLGLGLFSAIIAALMGAGPTALALQAIVTTIAFSISSLAFARWLPRARPRWSAARDLWSFSGWVATGNLVGYWGDNVDTLALGRTQAASEVGYYNRAFNLLMLPLQSLVNAPSWVAIPALAAMQEDVERSRRAWLSGVLTVARIAFPTCLGIAATAPAIVLALWGDSWVPVVPYLQVLALAGVPWAVSNACLWALLARGRSRRYFGLKLMNTGITVLLVVLGLQWGGIGVAYAMLLRSVLMAPVHIVGSLGELRISLLDVVAFLWRPAAASTAMGLLVAAMCQSLVAPAPVELALEMALGVLLYVAITAAIDREAMRSAVELARRKLRVGSTRR